MMKFTIFLSVLVLFLSTNIFADRDSIENKGALSGKFFFYLDQHDRMNLIVDLYKVVEARYALWNVKNVNMKIDGNKIFKKAISFELTVKDVETPFVQAKSNLEFLDRMTKLLASFKDTHFHFHPYISRPYILNGIVLMKVENKYRIVRISDKIISKNERQSVNSSYFKALAIGDIVTEIDGVKVEDAVNALKPYESASSDLYREFSAIYGLTVRSFRYPEKGYSDFKIFIKTLEKEVKVRMPWYFGTNEEYKFKKDAKFYLTKMKFKTGKDILLKFDKSTKKWIDTKTYGYEGFRLKQNPDGIIGATKWVESSSKDDALRTGWVHRDGKAYGILQLFTFHAKTVIKSGSKSDSVSFFDPIVSFINKLKKDKIPLILDLRTNGGGYSSYPRQILSIIAKTDEEYPSTTSSFRVTRSFRQIIETYDYDDIIEDIDKYNSWQNHMTYLKRALYENNENSLVFSNREKIVADPRVEGFDQPIVALITSRCISACDQMSMLLKASKRAVLVGTHSNGTGAGFYGDTGMRYYVGPYDVMSVRIPNHLFGYPGEFGVYEYEGDENFYKMNSENRPTYADITYEPLWDTDYLMNSKGWFNKAIDILNKPQ